jgi:hypothetical protein
MPQEPVVIHWQDFEGLREDDEILLNLFDRMTFRRDGLISQVGDLAPRRQTPDSFERSR